MNDNTYEKLATKIGTLVDSKNKQYGDSFAQSGEFLKLIYPNGIPADAYTDALCIVRIFDKLKRIGNASNLPVNEGKIDAWSDIIGYGLLGLQKDSEPVESGLGHAEMLARRIAAAKERHDSIRIEHPNGGIDTRVVNHREFLLDKSALEEAISQTEAETPTRETLEERRIRVATADMQDRVDRMTPVQRE